MVTALCTALMFLTAIIPIGTYAIPAIAGAIIVVIVIELGKKYAWLVFAASAILSFIVSADKEAAVFYILLFGYYPILKSLIEGRFNFVTGFVLKLLVFNIAAVLEFIIAINLLGITDDAVSMFGVYAPAVLLALGNVTFLLYDRALSLLLIKYIRQYRSKVLKIIGK